MKPEIVCFCGSTRFFRAFDEWNYRFTLDGYIVLNIGCNTKSDESLKLTVEDKAKLDELHKHKIDLCDWVFVLDVDGYIGESTRSEIRYAEAHGKPVRYLSWEHPGYKEPIHSRQEVEWFAGEMEKRLKANDHKGGWEDCSLEWLVAKLAEETGEVAAIVIKHGSWKEKVIKEAADVANVAMMIADLARQS